MLNPIFKYPEIKNLYAIESILLFHFTDFVAEPSEIYGTIKICSISILNWLRKSQHFCTVFWIDRKTLSKINQDQKTNIVLICHNWRWCVWSRARLAWAILSLNHEKELLILMMFHQQEAIQCPTEHKFHKKFNGRMKSNALIEFNFYHRTERNDIWRIINITRHVLHANPTLPIFFSPSPYISAKNAPYHQQLIISYCEIKHICKV